MQLIRAVNKLSPTKLNIKSLGLVHLILFRIIYQKKNLFRIQSELKLITKLDHMLKLGSFSY